MNRLLCQALGNEVHLGRLLISLVNVARFSLKRTDIDSIAALIARDKELTIVGEAMEKLSDIFEVAKRSSDFGNGRFVRNIIEQAKMAQAGRLVAMDYDLVTDKDIVTLCAEDVEMPLACSVRAMSRGDIGFR